MSEPIQMPNRQIAEAMITAGIPLDREGPCRNFYTQGKLRDLKASKGTLPPKQFEERVLEVAERKIAGDPVFFFQRTMEAEGFIQAWDKTAELIKLTREREGMSPEERAKLDPIPALPDISAEIVAQVLCMHAANRSIIPQVIFSGSPVCNLLEGEFTSRPTEGGALETATGVPIGETVGSGKVWSTDLDDVTRAKMGLHSRIKVWRNPYGA